MKKIFYILFIFLLNNIYAQQLGLIPAPVHLTQQAGVFILDNQTSFDISDDLLKDERQYLIDYLYQYYAKSYTKDTKEARRSVSFGLNKSMPAEAYTLRITPELVQIEGGGKAGVFYGIQTLIQLLPTTISPEPTLPCIEIEDSPRFRWRGMHLDVCRHFFPPEFIKKYIDIIASYKMNTFHWHLTDDQGWRIEIKKYPLLTAVGAWRNGTMIGRYSDHRYDTLRYGGFYTQAQIREIVAYAQKRHITIVPEIEMPGHAVAAIAAYPFLSCTGEQVEVGKKWGVEENVLCPTEDTFGFLEGVLTEVMDLFPGKYIHIGGDEVPKIAWKKSNFCQELIKKEKLKDEHGLQSYFIRRIERFIHSKGRQIIGWDEILEGGLAPNAAVMSWRGTEGGIAAAKQGHFAVMSPGSHCYFDHYQGNPANEPLAFGGYTTVEKTYSYEPIPKGLNPDEASYIMGAQGNIWTEYILTPEHVEYMALPRMAALAEVVWSPAANRNFSSFKNRLAAHFRLLDMHKINYSRSIFEVKTSLKPGREQKGIEVGLQTIASGGEILYGFNNNAPNISYKEPFLLEKSGLITAVYTEKGEPKGKPVITEFLFSKSTGRRIVLEEDASESYPGDGAFTLVNGIYGSPEYFGFQWLGWSGKDMQAVIHLDKEEIVHSVQVGYLDRKESWIHPPSAIRIFVSLDNQTFKEIAVLNTNDIADQPRKIVLNFEPIQTNYIKVIAEHAGKIPNGFPGAGEKAWLFIDEIGVE